MLPATLRTMPLVRRPKPFSHRDWIYEIKGDGFRSLAFIENGRCRLVSRNGNQFSSFDVLREALPQEIDAKSAVLDGEMVVLDDSGRSVFNDLLFHRAEPVFYAFRFALL